MPIPEASCHAETGKGSTWTSLPSFCFLRMTWQKKRQLVMDVTDVEGSKRHPLSSPTQFPWLRQLWGLRPLLSFASTEAPDFSSSTTTSSRPSSAARCSGVRPRGGGHEARPTGSRRERTKVGKLASCASCASLKSHSPTQTLHAI